jgi:hypothetical protein
MPTPASILFFVIFAAILPSGSGMPLFQSILLWWQYGGRWQISAKKFGNQSIF